MDFFHSYADMFAKTVARQGTNGISPGEDLARHSFVLLRTLFRNIDIEMQEICAIINMNYCGLEPLN